MLNSASNKKALFCNNIKPFHTKQFNRGISTSKSALSVKLEETEFSSVELCNIELNIKLFPIEFDDNSRAILDLPFILGDSYLKFINKKDNSIISFTSSINHFFLRSIKKKKNLL